MKLKMAVLGENMLWHHINVFHKMGQNELYHLCMQLFSILEVNIVHKRIACSMMLALFSLKNHFYAQFVFLLLFGHCEISMHTTKKSSSNIFGNGLFHALNIQLVLFWLNSSKMHRILWIYFRANSL